jgi:predicted enzyme related to lactoylglutathione lyase
MRIVGKIMHFEIIGRDAAKLHSFYRDLFGWKVGPAMPDMGNYALVDGSSSGVPGGIGEDETGAPRVTLYVQVADLPAALDKAASLGAKVVLPPTDIPGGPTIAMFADPAGNVTGLVKG